MKTRGTPKYRLHKASGKGIVTLPDKFGKRKDYLLPGKYGGKESKAEYARLIQLWRNGAQQLRPAAGNGQGLTVAEMLIQFWQHAEIYYRREDGSPATELVSFRYALRPLNFLCGNTLAAEFGPKALQSVREVMMNGYDHPEYGPQTPLARKNLNRHVNRIKHAFKWAVGQELIPSAVYHSLQSVEGLRRGRSRAGETEPVKPVPMAFVEQTIAAAPAIIADMIELQLLTGIRPGELVIMRGIDLDTSGPIWQYTPEKHKTQHHGHSRVIAIGPKGQAIIKRYLKADVQAPLFSPREAREARFRILRIGRKTKVQPSQVCRKRAKPKKLPASNTTWGVIARPSSGPRNGLACRTGILISSGTQGPRTFASDSASMQPGPCWAIARRPSPKSMPSWIKARPPK